MAGRHLEDAMGIRELLAGVRRVAVLGIKPETESHKPAFYVPKSLMEMGLTVLPVPTYDFGVSTILGQPLYRTVKDVPPPIDLVDVFRRPEDLPPHLPDLLAAKPKAVWLQLGIRNEAFADALVAAGIDVVQDQCLMVDYRRYFQTRG